MTWIYEAVYWIRPIRTSTFTNMEAACGLYQKALGENRKNVIHLEKEQQQWCEVELKVAEKLHLQTSYLNVL